MKKTKICEKKNKKKNFGRVKVDEGGKVPEK